MDDAGAGMPPSGVATFLFTDIEGSTWLLQHLGDEWLTTLHDHYSLLREAWAAHRGCEVSTEGDAFFVAFADASDAVDAAIDGQRRLAAHAWSRDAPVRVRIGIHTGEAQLYGADYVGLAVHQAARIKSAAHGGQILLSDATAEAAGGRFEYADLGLHRLKDLAQPVRLFHVIDPHEASDFPPPRTLSVMPNNFPIQPTTFVGRDDDITSVITALHGSRLVTLTGAGGVGKTRLALQAGAEVIDAFPDGAWLVDLAPLADPSTVATQVADALGIREQPGREIAVTLVDSLHAKRLLIVLDNCEHLIEACADVAHRLLTSCADVKVLATSREALNVSGERIYPLRSLDVPEVKRDEVIELVARSESVRLFVQRTRAIRPDFDLTPTNAPSVAQICRRLDGLPLAIELAAARTKTMSVQEIAERLDDRFRLLTGGARMALPRQRTLEATVAWSYGLLSEPEQRLFDRLSVFSGGCSLDAAERVCTANDLFREDVMDHIAHLVDRSLVVAEEGFGGRTRYRLLETLRQFGRDRLLAREELASIRDRHLGWIVDIAHTLPGQTGALLPSEIEEDDANIRAAIEWAIDSGQHAAGLGILAHVWTLRAQFDERERWYGTLLAATDQVPQEVAARALAGAGGIAFAMGDWSLGAERYRAAVAAGEDVGDHQIVSMSLLFEGVCRWGLGEDETAFVLLEQGLAAAEASGDEEMIRRGLLFTGWAKTTNDIAEAFDLAERVDQLSRAAGTPFDLAHARELLGFVQALRGELDASARTLAESMQLFEDARWGCSSHALETGAAWAAMSGRWLLGAELWGAAEGVREQTGEKPRPWERAVHDEWLPRVRAELDEVVFGEAFARGRRRTREEALAHAMEALGASGRP